MSLLDTAKRLARTPRSELLSRPPRAALLWELIDGIAPDPDRIVRLARAQAIIGNEQAHWDRHEAWALTRRWYGSLLDGTPDYSVYEEDDYLADVWACWLESSRETLQKILPRASLPPWGVAADARAAGIGSVVDLGCGIGITTAVLTELFGGVDVVGTNVPGCAQYRVAERLGRQYGFAMVPTVQEVLTENPLVFASEYFEHFEQPVAHLAEVLDALDPVALIVNNSFTQPSIGHFDRYLVDGARIEPKATSRVFNDTLRSRGYAQMATAVWNHRPAYWKRIW